MTERQRVDVWEKKQIKYYQNDGLCFICGKLLRLDNCQFAHKIAKTKANYSKYGKEVIDHIKNGEITCSDKFGRCNDACNIGNNPGKVLDLVTEIAKEII